eukprot:scaffold108828_cov49-Prasinocladus_malaysianus.AAC.1
MMWQVSLDIWARIHTCSAISYEDGQSTCCTSLLLYNSRCLIHLNDGRPITTAIMHSASDRRQALIPGHFAPASAHMLCLKV